MRRVFILLILNMYLTSYIIETTTGDLYHLTNSGPIFLENIHTIVNEKTRIDPAKKAIKPPLTEMKGILLTGNKLQTTNKPFFDHVSIDKTGQLVFKEDGKSLKLRYNVFDVLKEPRIIKNTVLTASKHVHLSELSSLNTVIFIISIVLQITDFNYKKIIVFNYVHSPFKESEKSYIRGDDHIILNGLVYAMDGNFIVSNVYKTFDYHGNTYLQRVHGDGRIEIYFEKGRNHHFFIWVVVLTVLTFLFIRIKRRTAIVHIKKTILEKKGYQICSGVFDGSHTIIKVYNKEDPRCDNEISILKENQIPYIVKYYCKEERDDSALIVLEDTKQVKEKILKSEIYEIIKVIKHLHDKKTVHNDICLENIRINKHNKLVLQNFEDSEKLKCHDDDDDENNSSEQSFNVIEKGSLNWRSPEIILSNNKIKLMTNEMKYKSDVFSLGLLLYYNETKQHPFYSDECEIEDNIVAGIYNLEYLTDHNLHDLICHCLKHNYDERSTIKQVHNHPYFWNNEKKFNFFANLSDFLENKCEESKRVYLRLERNKHKVFHKKWDNYMHKEIISELNNFRFYNFNSIKGLLRVIRNKGRHYKEMPREVKDLYGSFPNDFMEYFTSKFPSLVMVCHYSAKCSSEEELLKTFYDSNE